MGASIYEITKKSASGLFGELYDLKLGFKLGEDFTSYFGGKPNQVHTPHYSRLQ